MGAFHAYDIRGIYNVDFDKETAYKYFNEFMWGRRYAKIITVEEAVQILQSENKNWKHYGEITEQ